jgi:simple sugar transport system substrate-binding protein
MSSDPSSGATRRRFRRRAAPLLVLVVLLAGCSLISPQEPYRDDVVGGSVFEAADDIKAHVESGAPLAIRVSFFDSDLALADLVEQGVARAAQEFGVDAQLIGPAQRDPAAQIAELEQLIANRSVQGLAVAPSNQDDFKPVFATAYDSGIPLITINTRLAGSRQQGFVGQDLVLSGEFLANQLVPLLNGQPGKILAFSIDNEAEWSNDREVGFEAALEDIPELEFGGAFATTRDPVQMEQIIEQTMATEGAGTIAIVALDPISLAAVGDWVTETNNVGNVAVMGFDLTSQVAAHIQSGAVTGTVSSNPAEQGYNAVKVLVDFLREDVELHNVNTKSTLVTQQNLANMPIEG